MQDTLLDLIKQLQDIVNKLQQLSQDIVTAHDNLGGQLRQTSTDQKPLSETTSTKQGG